MGHLPTGWVGAGQDALYVVLCIRALVTVSHQSSAWAFRAALPVQRAGPQVVPDVPDLIPHVSLCLGEDDVGVDIPIAVGPTCAGIVAGGLLTAYPSRAMATIWLNHASVAAEPVLSILSPSSTGSLTPSPWERIASVLSGRYQGRPVAPKRSGQSLYCSRVDLAAVPRCSARRPAPSWPEARNPGEMPPVLRCRGVRR